MKYAQIWNAVDKLAELNGLSPSGLAKKAGLDSTTFNKSKRIRPDGKKRWPSLESINKIISVCDISFDDFYRLAGDNANKGAENKNLIAIFELSKIAAQKSETESETIAKIRFPEVIDKMYAVEIDCQTMPSPYNKGATVIVAEGIEIRRGDKILLIKNDSSVVLGKFVNRTASALKIEDFALDMKEITAKIAEVATIGRILWISQ